MKYSIMDMMKRNSLVCLILFFSIWLGISGLSGFSLSEAQENAPTAVKVRAARNQDAVRIVLTTEDFLVRNASVILTKNRTVKIDLRSEAAAAAANREKPVISFVTEKGSIKNDVPVEIIKSVSFVAKGDTCLITIQNVEDIKVTRLQSPARLVVDALFKKNSNNETAGPATPAIKPAPESGAFRYFVIDAGHGGYDYGIRGSKFSEKDFDLGIARDLSGMLTKSGKEAVLTRKSDQVLSIAERINLANKRTPDLLISIHASSNAVPKIYTIPEKIMEGAEPDAKAAEQKKSDTSRKIADAIAKAIEKEFAITVEKNLLPLPLLMRSKSAAVLIELPNPDEFGYDKKNKERLLSAIMKGIAAASKEERQPAPVPMPAPLPAPLQKPEKKPENNFNGKPEGRTERL